MPQSDLFYLAVVSSLWLLCATCQSNRVGWNQVCDIFLACVSFLLFLHEGADLVFVCSAFRGPLLLNVFCFVLGKLC